LQFEQAHADSGQTKRYFQTLNKIQAAMPTQSNTAKRDRKGKFSVDYITQKTL
jgi:hypothetical protein